MNSAAMGVCIYVGRHPTLSLTSQRSLPYSHCCRCMPLPPPVYISVAFLAETYLCLDVVWTCAGDSNAHHVETHLSGAEISSTVSEAESSGHFQAANYLGTFETSTQHIDLWAPYRANGLAAKLAVKISPNRHRLVEEGQHGSVTPDNLVVGVNESPSCALPFNEAADIPAFRVPHRRAESDGPFGFATTHSRTVASGGFEDSDGRIRGRGNVLRKLWALRSRTLSDLLLDVRNKNADFLMQADDNLARADDHVNVWLGRQRIRDQEPVEEYRRNTFGAKIGYAQKISRDAGKSEAIGVEARGRCGPVGGDGPGDEGQADDRRLLAPRDVEEQNNVYADGTTSLRENRETERTTGDSGSAYGGTGSGTAQVGCAGNYPIIDCFVQSGMAKKIKLFSSPTSGTFSRAFCDNSYRPSSYEIPISNCRVDSVYYRTSSDPNAVALTHTVLGADCIQPPFYQFKPRTNNLSCPWFCNGFQQESDGSAVTHVFSSGCWVAIRLDLLPWFALLVPAHAALRETRPSQTVAAAAATSVDGAVAREAADDENDGSKAGQRFAPLLASIKVEIAVTKFALASWRNAEHRDGFVWDIDRLSAWDPYWSIPLSVTQETRK